MSSVNAETGLVLTKKEMFSPDRTLVREQYPSIHGQLTWFAGSMRVLVSIQSRVPGFSFSRRIETLSPKYGFIHDATTGKQRHCTKAGRTLEKIAAANGRWFHVLHEQNNYLLSPDPFIVMLTMN